MVSTGSSGTLGETGRMFYLSTTRGRRAARTSLPSSWRIPFPDDRVVDGPYHTELRRRTDGSIRPPEASDILSEMDPPFTGAEVKMALKAFNPKKPLGLTGSLRIYARLPSCGTWDCSYHGEQMFAAGILSRAWKVATIKVIPKPGKDDYSRPKSYRPILSRNGKNRGKDARLAHGI
ncbi:hypothetical protein EVAR_84162_1 [Eumeta japonica]|uniref:Uncharacterized protein n=1 Tax=Eumeta variegata TaxID=151549 RepID=A0A4C2ACI0_EUMVA|nr:hypothetical protein EVAR_84162_1 [Eumeta japonica]